jgi:hypothetical protein
MGIVNVMKYTLSGFLAGLALCTFTLPSAAAVIPLDVVRLGNPSLVNSITCPVNSSCSGNFGSAPSQYNGAVSNAVLDDFTFTVQVMSYLTADFVGQTYTQNGQQIDGLRLTVFSGVAPLGLPGPSVVVATIPAPNAPGGQNTPFLITTLTPGSYYFEVSGQIRGGCVESCDVAYSGTYSFSAVVGTPFPIVGAGLPGLLALGALALVPLARRRRRAVA